MTGRFVWDAGFRRMMLIICVAVGGGAFSPRDADARPTVTWAVDASGQWTTATNWSSSPQFPGILDDVVIDRPAGDFEITLSSNPQSIKTLFSTERL